MMMCGRPISNILKPATFRRTHRVPILYRIHTYARVCVCIEVFRVEMKSAHNTTHTEEVLPDA